MQAASHAGFSFGSSMVAAMQLACDLRVLNSFSFCKKSEPLRKLDKLEQAMCEIFAN